MLYVKKFVTDSHLNNSMMRVCFWVFLERKIVTKRFRHSLPLQSSTSHNSAHRISSHSQQPADSILHLHTFIPVRFFMKLSSQIRSDTLIGKKGKVMTVTCRKGLQGCETSRLPHFLDSRFTDGGKVVSLTRRPPFTPPPPEVPRYSFLLETESIPGP
jgi:hypothetical protein